MILGKAYMCEISGVKLRQYHICTWTSPVTLLRQQSTGCKEEFQLSAPVHTTNRAGGVLCQRCIKLQAQHQSHTLPLFPRRSPASL